jgi:hypothetical protein
MTTADELFELSDRDGDERLTPLETLHGLSLAMEIRKRDDQALKLLMDAFDNTGSPDQLVTEDMFFEASDQPAIRAKMQLMNLDFPLTEVWEQLCDKAVGMRQLSSRRSRVGSRLSGRQSMLRSRKSSLMIRKSSIVRRSRAPSDGFAMGDGRNTSMMLEKVLSGYYNFRNANLTGTKVQYLLGIAFGHAKRMLIDASTFADALNNRELLGELHSCCGFLQPSSALLMKTSEQIHDMLKSSFKEIKPVEDESAASGWVTFEELQSYFAALRESIRADELEAWMGSKLKKP